MRTRASLGPEGTTREGRAVQRGFEPDDIPICISCAQKYPDAGDLYCVFKITIDNLHDTGPADQCVSTK